MPSSPSLLRWTRVYAVLAGACDTATGFLLIGAPEWTLRLMGIDELPSEPIYLRFIGVFVLGVGLSYLYPLVFPDGRRTDHRLGVVLEVTTLVRAAVALFVAAAIVRSALVVGWWSVGATDAFLAAVQIVILRRGLHELTG